MFVVLVLPFNIFYRSSRFFFLTCLFHCLAAPLYKVGTETDRLIDQSLYFNISKNLNFSTSPAGNFT